jgi:hypothetical protein
MCPILRQPLSTTPHTFHHNQNRPQPSRPYVSTPSSGDVAPRTVSPPQPHQPSPPSAPLPPHCRRRYEPPIRHHHCRRRMPARRLCRIKNKVRLHNVRAYGRWHRRASLDANVQGLMGGAHLCYLFSCGNSGGLSCHLSIHNCASHPPFRFPRKE